MPGDKSKSPLAKKYGQKRVARARDLVKKQMGKSLKSTDDADIPWGIVGKIAKNEKMAKKTISRKKITLTKKPKRSNTKRKT